MQLMDWSNTLKIISRKLKQCETSQEFFPKKFTCGFEIFDMQWSPDFRFCNVSTV